MGMPLPRKAASIARTGPEHRSQEQAKNMYSPVAVFEVPEVNPEDVDSVPETALAVAADAPEAAVAPPALATVPAPAMAELAAAVTLADTGQLAADGNFTLTLCRVTVNNLGFVDSQSGELSLRFLGAKDLRIA